MRRRNPRRVRVVLGLGLLGLLGRSGPAAPIAAADPMAEVTVRGVTISCQTWGWEWGTDGFGAELDELAALGVNWVAIHPYARIEADGNVRWRTIDPDAPPDWIARPIRAARERGMGILIKPHLAYWGSPFGWRGEIEFAEPGQVERFFERYGAWLEAVARAAAGADALAVGTELDRLLGHEAEWRAVIARVRAASDARLTYAANWTDFQRVPFWDALDAIGVQAYFPLSTEQEPGEPELRVGWEGVLEPLRALHGRSGKPVIFTEIGYNVSLAAAREPWAHAVASPSDRARACELQGRCYRVALDVLEREQAWLRGAFLWKWFVGDPGWNDADFLVDTPSVRSILSTAWGASGG